MFVNKLFTISHAHISKSKGCFNLKSSAYYFHMKTKILADFQICVSVPLIFPEIALQWKVILFVVFCTNPLFGKDLAPEI